MNIDENDPKIIIAAVLAGVAFIYLFSYCLYSGVIG